MYVVVREGSQDPPADESPCDDIIRQRQRGRSTGQAADCRGEEQSFTLIVMRINAFIL